MTKEKSIATPELELVRVTPEEKELLELCQMFGTDYLAAQLEKVHDLAVYFCLLDITSSDLEAAYHLKKVFQSVAAIGAAKQAS